VSLVLGVFAEHVQDGLRRTAERQYHSL
jgi:hypothetical protein